MRDVEKTVYSKIVCLNKFYKFSSRYFFISCIFYVLNYKNTFENQKLHFVRKICKIWRKPHNGKLFAQISS